MNSELATSDPQLATTSTADQEVLVKVEGVSKKFCRSLKKSLWYGLCDIGAELSPIRREARGPRREVEDGGNGLRDGEFWAVNDVSFELRRGECLGLIGHNGAGKTTLLKMLNGLIKPDAGKITMRGRVGALIALGAGFNPILTGRENIYINGSVLGLSKKEIDGKIDEIIDFAEIGEFIDTPVQNYSSGMSVRLGFAVASALEPDVLIIDEVLAVGDTSFKVKCYNKIRDLLPSTAVIFVSHSMFEVARVSSRVLVLERGREYFHGGVHQGVGVYNMLNSRSELQRGNDFVVHLGSKVASASAAILESRTNGVATSVRVELAVRCHQLIPDAKIRMVFHDDAAGDAPVAEWDSNMHGLTYSLSSGDNRIEVELNDIRLRAGRYRVIPVVTDLQAQGYHAVIERGLSLEITSDALTGAPYRI